MKQATEAVKPTPHPKAFVKSPLRNMIRVELDAPASEVWALVGNLTRYPEYSAGMERVDTKGGPRGDCLEYVCHFKPLEPGQPGLSHRETVRWWEPGVGYASSPDEGNAWGLRDTLTMVTLDSHGNRTLLTWTEHFEAQDLPMNIQVFDQALADIAQNLISIFGGQILERVPEGA